MDQKTGKLMTVHKTLYLRDDVNTKLEERKNED